MDLTTLLLAMSIPSAITGFCFWMLERKIQARDEEAKKERADRERRAEKRDQQRKEYESFQINMIAASMALSIATAQAVQRIPDAHCNGDMSAALDYAHKVKNEQKEFMQKMTIDHIDF